MKKKNQQLATKPENHQKRFIGAYLPSKLADGVILCAMLRNETKTAIIVQALTEKLSREKDIPAIVKILAERTWSEWKNKAMSNKYQKGWEMGTERAKFLKEKREELHQRGLSTSIADRILSVVSNYAET